MICADTPGFIVNRVARPFYLQSMRALERGVASVVDEYLREARRLGHREVRVIHGRGIGEQRRIVQAVLAGHAAVASFADAPPERGGWGATVVTLRADG